MSQSTSASVKGPEGKGTREGIQRFGRFLSGMVMPNIGAFIAWGLITALFIPTGWTPNENLSALVGPMITYLLPLLIGYTGGKMVADTRGGVVGAVATMGVVVGAGVPMFLGAMIMGPVGGYVIKKFDQAVEGKVASGFEMLVNNFSAGILGAILALVAYVGIGPVVLSLNNILKAGVEGIVNAGLLPITSLFIEPAKIMFLNNAINHGVLGPLAIQDASSLGKSIFFLLETNPGPGLGILLAYWMFGKGMTKQSAPGAIIIHFLGGIHEIYFPYVLMNPLLLLAVIAGGASGVFTFVITGAGLIAAPSPGSIFALLAMTPKGGFFGVIAGIAVSAAVSFLVASFFIKVKKDDGSEGDLDSAKEKVQQLKGKKTETKISKIVVACDAGMGSSAMGASTLRNKLKQAGVKVEVVNTAIDQIPGDADLIITHESLTQRAARYAPNAEHISIRDFLDNPIYDQLAKRLAGLNKSEEKAPQEEVSNDSDEILRIANIRLGLNSMNKEDVIKMAGQMLVDSGYVEEPYIQGMLEREKVTTTYIGNGIAIPHGVGSCIGHIKKSGIVVLQFPQGIDFGDDNKAYLIIGIAGKGNDHLKILSNIASSLEDEKAAKALISTKDPQSIYQMFTLEE
jgi:PTS system mannitol-specific IIC component